MGLELDTLPVHFPSFVSWLLDCWCLSFLIIEDLGLTKSFPFSYFKNIKNVYMQLLLTYSFVLVSGVQHQIIFHYKLLQDIE